MDASVQDAGLHFLDYPLGVQIGLIIALIGVTIFLTRKGFQHGIVLALATGMGIFPIFPAQMGLPSINMDRIVWPILLIMFVVKRRHGETQKLPLNIIEYCMIALVAIVLMSVFLHGSYTSERGGEEGWRFGPFMYGFAMPFTAYFLTRRTVLTEAQVRSFLVGLGCITFYLVFSGVAEACKVDALVFPKAILNPNTGIHFGKVRGIFLNASFNGLAIAMALPFMIWLFFNEWGIHRWVWGGIATLASIPLAFSYQRAVWLGAAAALFVTIFAWPKRRIILAGGLLMAVSVGMLGVSDTVVKRLDEQLQNQESLDFRVDMARISWEMIRDHPIFGIGFNQFKEQTIEYFSWHGYSHNTLLTNAVELGVIGLLPYCTIFAFFGIRSLRLYWSLPEYRAIIGALLGATAAYGIVMLALEVRIQLYLNALLFTLWGAILEVISRRTAEQQPRFTGQRAVVNLV